MLTLSKDTLSITRWKCGDSFSFFHFGLGLVHKLFESHYVEKAPVGRPCTETNYDPRLDQMDHWSIGGEGKDHICEVCNLGHKHQK